MIIGTVGTMTIEHFDVLIIGAGLSGIGAGYHLQNRCPGRSYVILEGRDRIGGTWDLFRYPGIRSDSDMYTLGYSFRPWEEAKAIADGPSILKYVRGHCDETTASTARSASATRSGAHPGRRRTRSGRSRPNSAARTSRCNSAATSSLCAAGYYSYAEGYTPEFPGMRALCGPHRAPAEVDRRHRLRRQARSGDRQRRHGGDAGAGDWRSRPRT